MRPSDDEKEKIKYLTITETAKKYKRTRQLVWLLIRKGRLLAQRIDNVFYIKEDDYKRYVATKYKRFSPVFLEPGNHSVKDCSEMLKCSIQCIYHHLRSNNLKSKRNGCSWIIHIDDIEKFKLNILHINKYPGRHERKFKFIGNLERRDKHVFRNKCND